MRFKFRWNFERIRERGGKARPIEKKQKHGKQKQVPHPSALYAHGIRMTMLMG
jgi:hypothetical protein